MSTATLTAAFPRLRIDDAVWANAVWIAFVAAQACDGLFTYVGIQWHGLEAEANPFIAWYAAAFGTGVTVLGAKLFATACGAILHFSGRHWTLTLLTGIYTVFALWPWTLVLWG